MWEKIGFNSIKVRLKAIVESYATREKTFQFHKGTIKRTVQLFVGLFVKFVSIP